MRFLDLASIRVEVLNFALVTYEVPAERVRPLLPEHYSLDTFEDERGSERCFISATCFCNQDFRWAASPLPRHTFSESTYRTYVTHGGHSGVYFFGRYLGTELSYVSQRSMARDTFNADFDVAIEASEVGYRKYVCHAASSAGETRFSISALDRPPPRHPFSTGDELAQFITYRLRGFYTSSVGAQAQMPVSHPRMEPFAGELQTARFDLWDELGILTPEEAQKPYSVLVEPGVPFRLHPMRPVRKTEVLT